MDVDEVFALLAGVAAAVWGACWWWVPLWTVRRRRAWVGGWIAPTVAAGCLAGVWWVLTTMADPAVRGHAEYELLFFAWGAAWLMWGLGAMGCFGVSWRDDVIERRNPAALPAACGVMMGATCVYAGSNIGTGPTIWTTLGPAALGTAAWLGAWIIMQSIGRVAEAVTVERDVASGVRLLGVLAAAGLIIGTAVAGDWESAMATVRDVVVIGWSAWVIGAVGGAMQRLLRPRVGARPDVWTAGWAPAAMLVGLALLWVLKAGAIR
ncbi:MAG TPA: hypothetical protein VH253_03225 [Phycisphaerae bacterium]|nr:hypothetical protein [Phycisphaerae bacterium]